MALHRTKSEQDIKNQLGRISSLGSTLASRAIRNAQDKKQSWDDASATFNRTAHRVNRAANAGARYLSNIHKTQSYQEGNKEVKRLLRQSKSKNAKDPTAGTRAQEQLLNKQYSRRTYMGLNEG